MLKGLRELGAVAPRVFWYVWWGTLVNRLGGFVVPLFTIYLTKDRGLEVPEAGAIVSVFGIGQIAASIVGGQMSDRLGRRFTMLVSLFGGAIAMTLLGLAHAVPAITALVGVLGFVGELYRPAVAAFVADVVPPSHRLAAYGLLHWVVNVGFAFAAVVGGFVADIDFTLLFFADAATMAAYGVIVLVAVPETRPPRAEASAHAGPARSWLTDGHFLIFILIAFGIALLPVQSGAALSAHMTAQGFSAFDYGLVMGANGVLIIAVQPILIAWCARFPASRVLAVACLLYGAGFALHGLAPTVPLHVGAVVVWTLGEILESPTRSSIAAALAPADARGRYQGAMVMAWGGAFFLGPNLGPSVWEHVGPDALWLGCLGLGATLAAVVLATSPARQRAITARSRSGSS